MSAVVAVTQVSDTVEVVEVRLVGGSRMFEVRCSRCPVVGLWDHERFAVLDAGRHVCRSVRSRLGQVWEDTVATQRARWSRADSNEVRMFAEVCAILDEHGITRTDEQSRKLRWLCGWEWDTVAALVELMVAGQGDHS